MSRCALAHDANGVLWPELHHGRCSLAEVGIYLNCCQRSARRMVCAGRFGAMREADGVWLDKGASGKGRGIIRCCPARLWRARGLGRYGAFANFDPQRQGPAKLYFSAWDKILNLRDQLMQVSNLSTAQANSGFPVTLTPDVMGQLATHLAATTNEVLALLRRSAPSDVSSFPMHQVASR
jgi:hypothetical protein